MLFRFVAIMLVQALPAAASHSMELKAAADHTVTVTVGLEGRGLDILGRDEQGFEDKFEVGFFETFGKDSEGSDIKFRIRVDAAGQMSFNGVDGPVVDPWGRYSFLVGLTSCAGGTVVDLTVSDRWGRTVWRVSREVAGAVSRMEVRASRVLDVRVSD